MYALMAVLGVAVFAIFGCYAWYNRREKRRKQSAREGIVLVDKGNGNGNERIITEHESELRRVDSSLSMATTIVGSVGRAN